MANLGIKNGSYVIRFRYGNKEYQRSLKTTNSGNAKVVLHAAELVLHRLLTGQLMIPEGVDPGYFIVSGGTLSTPPVRAEPPPPLPSTRTLMESYLEAQRDMLATSYLESQKIHLRHFTKFLGSRVDAPCNEITRHDVEKFLRSRLKIRNSCTVARERVSLVQFYKWLPTQEGIVGLASPTADLFTIKVGKDPDPFRTLKEIETIIERGGLEGNQLTDVWNCLYLNPAEISRLLATVHARATDLTAFMLHAIPAYTGMRRGEILRLTWLVVDLDNGFITARSRKQSRTKTETIRRIDLHAELQSHLMHWRSDHPKGQYVVCAPGTLQPLSRHIAHCMFQRAMRGTEWCLDSKRQWYKIGFHTYRHSFASNLAAAGIDQRIIDEFMGHQTEAMRKRYRHLFPKNRRSAIESFSLAAPVTNLKGETG